MKRQSPLRKQSRKEVKIKREYSQVCKEMDQREMDDYGYLTCKSCEITVGHGILYGHSHNLPKGQFKSLETDPGNIAIRCQDFKDHRGCHSVLDSCQFEIIKDFKDLQKIMVYRKMHSKDAYNQFVTGLRAVRCEDFDYII